MLVDLEDGCCRECEGQLEITHFDDACLWVCCSECNEDYEVETDFFGDGCVKYYFAMQCQSLGLDPNDVHQ